MAWVYLLECSDGSLYCGVALDLERRLAQHQAGKGARYTAGRLPVRLAYSEEHPSMSEALRREADIKRWPRRRKASLFDPRSASLPASL